MSENNEDLSYLGEEELLSVDSPFATGASGYVEEQVDLWVQEARTRHENLINKYNTVIYRTAVAENSVGELTEELNAAKNDVTVSRERVSELENELETHSALLEASNADVVRLEQELAASREAVSQAEIEAVPTVSDDTDDEHVALIQQLDAQVKHLQDALDERENRIHVLSQELENAKFEVETAKNLADEYMAAPTVAETVVTASDRAQRILEEAAAEASEHVSRAIDRVQVIEDEAKAEAVSIREEALTDAEDIKATAVADAADAVAQFEAANTATRELFERVRSFHEFQLENINATFNLVEEAEEVETSDVSYEGVVEALRDEDAEVVVGEVRDVELTDELDSETEVDDAEDETVSNEDEEDEEETDYSYQTSTESIDVVEVDSNTSDSSDDYQETTSDEESEETDETRY